MKKVIIASICAYSVFAPSVVLAEQITQPPGQPVENQSVVVGTVEIKTTDPAYNEYMWQIEHGAPGAKYWSRVAKCETNSDWDDHGTWAGGLGIYNQARFTYPNSGTWERWGGEQFALHPSKATALQQIVVANRIAMFGWRSTYRDWDGITERVIQKVQYKKPAGFNGWGCIKQHRNGKKKGQWNIDLNPTRFENRRKEYWKNPIPYKTHELVLHKMNIPGWAKNKFKSEPWRLR